MKKKGIILLGAGGHCKSCIEVIESTGEFEIEGILNRGKEIDNVLGYPVLAPHVFHKITFVCVINIAD